MSNNMDVIDLTSSFTLVNHSNLTNEVICLDSDDSFEISRASKNDLSKKTTNQPLYLDKKQDSTSSSLSKCEKKTAHFGNCPICWDEVGNNPMASTMCGHVFCLECLTKSLKVEKKCPTCRHSLRGKNSYHQLYLNRT